MTTAAETVFVPTEKKLAIAGNLESAYRSLDGAWSLWMNARRHGWDRPYWNKDDVCDLERLVLIACYAIENVEQALGAVSAERDEPRTDDADEDSEYSLADLLATNDTGSTGGLADGDSQIVPVATPASLENAKGSHAEAAPMRFGSSRQNNEPHRTRAT